MPISSMTYSGVPSSVTETVPPEVAREPEAVAPEPDTAEDAPAAEAPPATTRKRRKGS